MRDACDKPSACEAKTEGKNCRRCNMIKKNSDPSTAAERSRRSSETMKKILARPEFIEAHRARMLKRVSNPEFHEKRVRRLREAYSEPGLARKHVDACKKKMAALNADPEFAQARNERFDRVRNDEALQTRRIENLKHRHANDPVFAQKHVDHMKRLNADPSFRLGAHHTFADPENQARAQEAIRRKRQKNEAAG